MTSPTVHRQSPTRRRLGLALAVAAAATALGPTTATAAPANPGDVAPGLEIPRGMPQIVSDVLGPDDPAFWNPAISGTRVLTPIEPGAEVACATGFVPVISCSTGGRSPYGPGQRTLEFVDVPVIGGAPLRIWVDLPRWGDGSTGEGRIAELTQEAIVWWLTNPTPS
ncbi:MULTISPECIES: hypothetical protein [unclassified Dietzia]|uniref:hypothetical protein n=1 Tax=unclassified Dietzia TaxID=2617939 RepID=UPI0015F9C5FC|nr:MULTISPECIES: hypothetical protein [unclassified Dietzia]MBB1023693.1 hypothetical protein [Dietzia sp. DQ12-76]MBB1027253.1 hypothetical protein [Dietzia sp. DQ11-38-2]